MQHPFKKRGFTIVEVALFLALSGFLMVGIVVGANRSITRQRYNDSVNSFAEYIRGIYSDVMNVSNDKDPTQKDDEAGRTKSAVYGKVLSFGETDNDGNIEDKIYVYDLVGHAVGSASIKGTRVIDMMRTSLSDGGVNANIFDNSDCPNPVDCHNAFYRISTYEIPWMGSVGQSHTNATDTSNTDRFIGIILIIRSPITGSTRTYVYSYAKGAHVFHRQLNDGSAATNFTKLLKTISEDAAQSYGERDLTLCIDSDDNPYSNRRGLKITARANNSSGVMLTELDANDSLCKGRNK